MSDPNASTPFLALPSEVHARIFEYLGFPQTPEAFTRPQYPTLAALNRTCKLAHTITEPNLFYKIYTNAIGNPAKDYVKSSQFTTGKLVDLLKKRSSSQKYVHSLVLDRFEKNDLKRLLSLDLENLESLICQHDGKVKKDKKGAKGDDVRVHQHGKLKNRKSARSTTACVSLTSVPVTLSIQQTDGPPYALYFLALSDASILNQPSITRFRLSFLDLNAFTDLPPSAFLFTNLVELHLEHCSYSLSFLRCLIASTRSLHTLGLYTSGTSPFPNEELDFHRTLLQSPAAKSLKIIRLIWCEAFPPPSLEKWPGLSFTEFPALRYLHIPPSFLFPYTGSPLQPNIDLMARTLPPRLRILALERLIPLHHPGESFDIELELSNYDVELLTALCDYKKAGNVPHFRHLYVFYAELMGKFPRQTVVDAAEAEIKLGYLQECDLATLMAIEVGDVEGNPAPWDGMDGMDVQDDTDDTDEEWDTDSETRSEDDEMEDEDEGEE